MNGRCYFKRSLPFLRIAEQSTALVKNSYVVRSWLYNARTSLPECLLFQCCLQDGGTIHVRESWTSWTRKSPFFWYWYKTKITKEANRVKLLFPVSCSKFVLYFPKYSSIFCQDKAFSWESHTILFPRSLYRSTARCQGTSKEAGIRQVSKVAGNMWKKLPTDRRKVGYELRTLRMFVYYPALFQWVLLQK